MYRIFDHKLGELARYLSQAFSRFLIYLLYLLL